MMYITMSETFIKIDSLQHHLRTGAPKIRLQFFQIDAHQYIPPWLVHYSTNIYCISVECETLTIFTLKFTRHGGIMWWVLILSSWCRIFSSRSRSRKIRILLISKFFVYCCHVNFDFNKSCI